jgi:hypothetical protein
MSKNCGKLRIGGESYVCSSLERVKVICTNSPDTGTCETVTFFSVSKCCAFFVQACAGDGRGALYYFKLCLYLCRDIAPSPATRRATGGSCVRDGDGMSLTAAPSCLVTCLADLIQLFEPP